MPTPKIKAVVADVATKTAATKIAAIAFIDTGKAVNDAVFFSADAAIHAAYSSANAAIESAAEAALGAAFKIASHYSRAIDVSEAALAVDVSYASRLVRTTSFGDAKYIFAQLMEQPLWNEPSEPDFLANWRAENELHLEDAAFSFWNEWYQGFLVGQPLDWELQKRIALIDSDIWEAGAEAVAEEIERVKAQWLRDQLPEANQVVFDEATNKFSLQVKRPSRPQLLAATLSQAEDALEDALNNPSNGLRERSREALVLRRTFAKYGNNPVRIEMDFTSVHAGLTRQFATNELPESEENVALQKALAEGAQGIRATDPEVAENRRILSQQAIAELDEDQLAVIAEAQPVLEEISEGELAEDWADDISFLLSQNTRLSPPPSLGGAERNHVLAGYNEKVRVFSRAAKILILLKRPPKIIAEFSKSDNGRAILFVSAIVSIGIALIS